MNPSRKPAGTLASLVRNMGSSIGISVVSVFRVRNIQVNHAESSSFISPFKDQLMPLMPGPVAANHATLAQLNEMVNIQALMISYVDDFKLMIIITLCALPLGLILRKPKTQGGPQTPIIHAD